ncbi:MAG: hypothetical protein R3D44_05065 [Hyphomicrobiaceae bacterium]
MVIPKATSGALRGGQGGNLIPGDADVMQCPIVEAFQDSSGQAIASALAHVGVRSRKS